MNKLLPIVTTWMDLEDITLSEVSQTEKNKYHMISLTCLVYKQNKQDRNSNSQVQRTD